MYFGPFYFDTKEIFIIVAAIIVLCLSIFNIPLLFFEKETLLALMILLLITKGLLPSIHNDAFFVLAMTTIFLSLWLSLFHVTLFYFLSFLFFRLFRVI